MSEAETQLDIALLSLSEPRVELPTVLGDIDLHNFAGFDGFRDCSAAGRAWRASPPRHVTVWFEGVRSLNVSGRDQHVPRSEDRGLEDFTCQTFTASDVRFQFRFGSGTTIDIVAQSVSVRLSAD